MFPQFGVGRDLLVSGEILQLYAATAGCVSAQIFVPALPPLVGTPFYQQMIAIEVDAEGALVSVSATNALQSTAGMF